MRTPCRTTSLERCGPFSCRVTFGCAWACQACQSTRAFNRAVVRPPSRRAELLSSGNAAMRKRATHCVPFKCILYCILIANRIRFTSPAARHEVTCRLSAARQPEFDKCDRCTQTRASLILTYTSTRCVYVMQLAVHVHLMRIMLV